MGDEEGHTRLRVEWQTLGVEKIEKVTGLWLGERFVAHARCDRYDWLVPAEPWEPSLDFRSRQTLINAENGFALSAVWGTATYSDNHDHGTIQQEFEESPLKVEVAIQKNGGNCPLIHGIQDEPDNVLGYVLIDELSPLLKWMDSLPHDAEPPFVIPKGVLC